MKFYRKDPRILKAKFKSRCPKCRREISPGEQIIYWPITRTAFCWSCGELDYLEFLSAAADEAGIPF
jgi:hypothetical protein